MYEDLSRPPLSERALAAALTGPDSLWTSIRVVAETGSTNADLAAGDAAEGSVLVAEFQNAGRGRLDRGWVSPPRAGLTFSLLLRPDVPRARWGWLPLLAGVALAEAVGRLGALEARLKWPNDLLLGPERRKGAGLLAQTVNGAVVVGIGLNVLTRLAELPAGATSLAVEGAACTDRDPLLRAILRALESWYGRWRAAAGDADGCGLRAAYRGRCDTLGRDVVVTVPGAAPVRGMAGEVDGEGRLVVGNTAIAAGDVAHVRVGSGGGH